MLRVQSLSFSYSDLLFHNVSFHVSKGELLAIIGLNGCGKSTLLSCLMGEKKPSEGSIISDFSHGFGAIPQESPVFHGTTWDFIMAGSPTLFSLYKNMCSHPEDPSYIWQYEEKGGFLWEQKLYKELSIFGFEDSILQRDYQVLSGGEKKFLQLIQLFLSDKSCFFLDEPTNDLDIHKRMRLASILQSKKKEGKAFVIISHDRDLLNHCADAIYYMRFQSGAMYTGSYDDFRKRLDEEQKRQEQTAEIIDRKIHRLQREVVLKAGWANKGYANNVKNREKHGKKGRPKDFRVGKMEKQYVIAKQKKEDQIQKYQEEKPRIEETGTLSIPPYTVANRLLVKAENVSFGYDTAPILQSFSFEITTQNRMVIVGENGCGKSTLMQLCNGVLLPEKGTMYRNENISTFYIPQDIRQLYRGGCLLDHFLDVNAPVEMIRSFLASNGLRGDIVLQPVDLLSPGQLLRATCSKIVLQKVEFLFLDEPTNHLDIPSIEELENALGQFPGGFLCCSHDQQFIRSITKEVFQLQPTHVESVYL
jgi:ATP-binding cassette subfamily F protein 3